MITIRTTKNNNNSSDIRDKNKQNKTKTVIMLTKKSRVLVLSRRKILTASEQVWSVARSLLSTVWTADVPRAEWMEFLITVVHFDLKWL